MKIVVRLLLFGGIVAVLAAATLALAPIPALDHSPRDRAVEALALERSELLWQKIRASRNLEIPLPAMPQRAVNPTSPAKVELGRLLYFDPLLSGANDLSCAHCHHPDLGFSDNLGRSMGRGGTGLGRDRQGGDLVRRGSPTVWNAAYNHVQFWDGRARDLEEQAGMPMMDPHEMAETPANLEAELRANAEYARLFDGTFGGQGGSAVSFENASFALAAFERTLISTNSRFDRYARGERSALSERERRGLNLFRSLKTRCFECHNLPTFANADFKVIGVPDVVGGEPDLGRSEIEGGAAYERAFKVPTLRNVALTAPYMHNGKFETLEAVLEFYSRGGGRGFGLEVPNIDDKIRPFALKVEERADLIAFLHALTDESAKPTIPERVPSGLPVVPPLANQSPELAAYHPSPEPPRLTVVRRAGRELRVLAGERIQDAIDAAQPGDVVVAEPGIYHETLTLDVSDLTLRGEVRGSERATLDGRGVLSDGIIGSGGNLTIEGFAIRHYVANGAMINLGRQITFRDLHFDDTGLYGVYPVEVAGVLIERCSVRGAKDAGIYVGQSRDIVVRDNLAAGNVTGIEIENSEDALVQGNEVTDNAGGILVFGLPNNPAKVSRRCQVIGNKVHHNNHVNFGDPAAVVAKVPSGSGIYILAGDDVEVRGNEIVGNDSFGIAITSLEALFGPGNRYDLDPWPDGNRIEGNVLRDNGRKPAQSVIEAGFHGADLLWDLTGERNIWQQPGASRLPYALPAPEWSPWRERLNGRLWRLLARMVS
jgi:cytochrome c peroxidase